MNKKIEKPNYTQIPNIYLDEIMYKLSPAENIVLLFIMRKTFGWHKEKDVISYSQIEKATGISRPTVSKSLKGLIEKGLIKAKNVRNGIEYSIIFSDESKENELVNKVDQLKNLTSDSKDSLLDKPKTSKNSLHTKESNLNKLSKEIYSPKSLELANLLYSLHKEIDTGFNRTSKQIETWASDIDKINRLDSRSFDDIEKTIRWVKNDDFWKTNIISGEKLRAKFDSVFIKAKGEHKLPSSLEGKIMLDL